MPTKNARSMPRCVSSASASSAESQYVNVAGGLGLPEAPLVPGDAAELTRERGHLRHEHLVVHQEPVAEEHRPGRRRRNPRSRCVDR